LGIVRSGVGSAATATPHTNDLVTRFDPHNWDAITSRIRGGKYGRTAGDWRQDGQSKLPGLKPHELPLNMFELGFADRIREDLGLP
jgi:hypothetical protein